VGFGWRGWSWFSSWGGSGSGNGWWPSGAKGVGWFSDGVGSSGLGRRGSFRDGNVLFVMPLCGFQLLISELRVQIDIGAGEFDGEFVFLSIVVLESQDFVLRIHAAYCIGFIIVVMVGFVLFEGSENISWEGCLWRRSRGGDGSIEQGWDRRDRRDQRWLLRFTNGAMSVIWCGGSDGGGFYVDMGVGCREERREGWGRGEDLIEFVGVPGACFFGVGYVVFAFVFIFIFDILVLVIGRWGFVVGIIRG
jgi:hypothetical protein